VGRLRKAVVVGLLLLVYFLSIEGESLFLSEFVSRVPGQAGTC